MSKSVYKKNNRKKFWTIWKVAVICLILVACIFAGVYYLYPNPLDNDEDIRCSTESCLEAAVEIMSSLNRTTDPCEDFYEFACGNFIANAEERNIPSLYFVQHVKNVNKLNAIISEPMRGDERKALSQQKTFYQACMNVVDIHEDDSETFMQLLEELGGWPVTDGQKWMDDSFNLSEVIIKCQHLGLPFQWFFQFKFDKNLYELHINSPEVVQQEDSFDSLRHYMYLNLMVETAVQLGASRIIATNEMTKVITFEKELENVILKNSQNTIMPMDISTLDSTFPRFIWLQFIDNLMEDFNYTQAENYLINSDATYLRELNSLLAKTSKRTQANFIIWKVVQEFGLYLSRPIRENFENYRSYIKLGDKPYYQTARFECCLEDARARFLGVAETEFIHRYIDEEKYQNIIKMIAGIKEQFIEQLSSAKWIDGGIKEVTINKLKNIVEIIGLEELDFSDDAFEYTLDIYPDFTTENIIDMIREKNINDFKRLFILANVSSETDISDTSWTLEIYATYVDFTNTLFFSAGIVQDIFYNDNMPNYLNYGALGSVIGRKLAEGFSGYAYSLNEEKNIIVALYNESVYRIKELMSLNTTGERNNETIEISFHSPYEIEMETKLVREIDEQKFIIENFVDFIGIEIAYEAYTKWIEENYEEGKLISLPYTPLQMFWIQFGRINCYKTVEGIKWPFTEDSLIFTRYTVINSVRHSANFAKDFGCPAGTPMNPF